jgi:hypothetical protein
LLTAAGDLGDCWTYSSLRLSSSNSRASGSFYLTNSLGSSIISTNFSLGLWDPNPSKSLRHWFISLLFTKTFLTLSLFLPYLIVFGFINLFKFLLSLWFEDSVPNPLDFKRSGAAAIS